MTDSEFYAQIQAEWFHEFKEHELSTNSVSTNVHDEFFLLEDVPF
jgi:hypothetical protein